MSTRLIFDAVLQVVLQRSALFSAPELYALIRSVKRSEHDLDEQVQEAFDALAKSSDLIENLGAVLKEREVKLNTLRSEYERMSQLATLTASQADAVAASLTKAIGASQLRERMYAFLINIVAGLILFVVGVVASDYVKKLFEHFL